MCEVFGLCVCVVLSGLGLGWGFSRFYSRTFILAPVLTMCYRCIVMQGKKRMKVIWGKKQHLTINIWRTFK